jgi:hypothetical protein
MRRFFLTLGITPALLGAALTAGITLATPSGASAYDPCPFLEEIMAYHDEQGNTDYVQQLAEWGQPYNCGFETA